MKLVGVNVSSISVCGRVYLPGPDGAFEMPVEDAVEALSAGHGLVPAPPPVASEGDQSPATEQQPQPGPQPLKGGRRGRR